MGWEAVVRILGQVGRRPQSYLGTQRLQVWVYLKEKIIILHDWDINVTTKTTLFDLACIFPIRGNFRVLHITGI